MYAIISDIHSNLSALNSVLADIKDKGIHRIVCLGDIVGYGPDPAECLRTIRKSCAWSVKGNHDLAVVLEPFGFGKNARDAAIWTKHQLEPTLLSTPFARRDWSWLQNLPDRMQKDGALYVHGSPRDPVMEYILPNDVGDETIGPTDKLTAIFDQLDGLCFVGHTHSPGVFTPDYSFYPPSDLGMEWVHKAGACIVNVGSVGQPRDNDPRSCYVTVDGSVIRFHRVAYDIDATVNRIHANAALADALGDRLRDGR